MAAFADATKARNAKRTTERSELPLFIRNIGLPLDRRADAAEHYGEGSELDLRISI